MPSEEVSPARRRGDAAGSIAAASHSEYAPASSVSSQRSATFRAVIDGPLSEIASRFSEWLTPHWPHDALIIYTRDCSGTPRKAAGDSNIVARVTTDELDTLKGAVGRGEVTNKVGVIAGARRVIWTVLDPTDTLLVLLSHVVPTAHPPADDLMNWFGIVSTSIRQQVTQASPDFLAVSRAASSERARIITEMTELQDATLSSILGTLRSNDLNDRHARMTASETASVALIALRSTGVADRTVAEEAVSAAFGRLQAEVCSVLSQAKVDVDFMAPPSDGRPLPGEIAHAARAIIREIVLAFVEQSDLNRLRIAWDCDGENVLMEVRDHGQGRLDRQSLGRQLTGRLCTLRGSVDMEVVSGWGSRVSVAIPLDPPARRPKEHLLTALNPREVEVLSHRGIGKRNKAIATDLGISESTVKFHISSVLAKLAVSNRAEAGAIAVRACLTPS